MKKYKKFLFNEREWQQVIANLNNKEVSIDAHPTVSEVPNASEKPSISPVPPITETVADTLLDDFENVHEDLGVDDSLVHQDVTTITEPEYEAKSFDEVRASLEQELAALNDLKEEAARSSEVVDIDDYRLNGSSLDDDVLSFDEIEPESYGMRRAG